MTQHVQHVPGFIPWLLLGRPPLLAQCVDLDCVCTMWPSRTWSTGLGMFHRSLLKTVTPVPNMYSKPSIHPPTSPQAYNATQFRWHKLFNRSMYSSAVHGCTLENSLQTQFTSQSTKVTACRVETEGAKTDFLSAI